MRDKLERLRSLLNEILAEMDGPSSPAEIPVAASKPMADDFMQLKSLLDSPDWPQAVFAAQIADESSERDKEDRAEGIAEIMLPPYGGKRFLDFGCGEGHVARYVSKESSLSVGYDILRSPASSLTWEEKVGNLLLTVDWGRVESEGPYDLILLYDVVDHCECDPAEVLRKAASVLALDGKIVLRCHPWCGRHGGHLYRKINKAFAHLVFTDEELSEMGVEVEHNNKVLRPLNSYTRAIEAAGLVKASEPEVDSQEVEDFFRETSVVSDRILRNWGLKEWGQDPPQFQMSQCFVDWTLKKK